MSFQNFDEAFVAGFESSAPAGYDVDADSATSAPWCAPWFWQDAKEWFDASLTPYEMGKRHAEKVYDELEAVLEEEEEYALEEDDA